MIIVENPSQLPAAAQKLLSICQGKKHFAFYGEMGAGKTTFIKAICKALGVEGSTASPTFSIINEYPTKTGDKIFHFDFYRIKNETEALDLGYEEYFYSGNYCFIEWPEKIQNLLPQNCVSVKINIKNQTREIEIK